VCESRLGGHSRVPRFGPATKGKSADQAGGVKSGFGDSAKRWTTLPAVRAERMVTTEVSMGWRARSFRLVKAQTSRTPRDQSRKASREAESLPHGSQMNWLGCTYCALGSGNEVSGI
jgi:hypothetical protein